MYQVLSIRAAFKIKNLTLLLVCTYSLYKYVYKEVQAVL